MTDNCGPTHYSGCPCHEARRNRLLEAAKMVLQRWTFNENQWHTHTWHDMADCATVLRAAIAACERNENA